MKWRKGSPPSIGWWPASNVRKPGFVRWWDGSLWSMYARPEDTPERAAQRAASKAPDQEHIEWAERPASWGMKC